MFCMNQTLSDFIKLISTILILAPPRNNRFKKLFEVVPDIQSRLILPGVDKRDLHVSRG
jgi:hypothetical protein